MTVEQLLTLAWDIMRDDQESATASALKTRTDKEVLPTNLHRGAAICYRCSGPNFMARDCMLGCSEGTDNSEMWCFKCDKIRHISEMPEGRGRQRQSSS